MNDEQQFMEIATKVMTDDRHYPLMISLADSWILASAIQLALRHPHLGDPLKKHLRKICDQFIDQIATVHPEASDLLEMGYDERYDVEAE